MHYFFLIQCHWMGSVLQACVIGWSLKTSDCPVTTTAPAITGPRHLAVLGHLFSSYSWDQTGSWCYNTMIPNTAANQTEWLKKKRIKVLQRTRQSSNIILTEMVCDLKRAVQTIVNSSKVVEKSGPEFLHSQVRNWYRKWLLRSPAASKHYGMFLVFSHTFLII